MNDKPSKRIVVSLNVSGANEASKEDFDKIRKIVLDAIKRLEERDFREPNGGTNGVINELR